MPFTLHADHVDATAASGADLGTYALSWANPVDSPRPFWHPLRTPRGTLVTDFAPVDHLWHWGLSLAIANIRLLDGDEPVNLWGGPTFQGEAGYVHAGDNGSQQNVSWSIDEAGGFVHELRWLTPTGRAFVRETRTFSLAEEAEDSSWTLSCASRWENLTAGAIEFGSPTTAGRPDAGYGGWFLRPHPRFVRAEVDLDGRPSDGEAARGEAGTTLTFTTAPVDSAGAPTAGADEPGAASAEGTGDEALGASVSMTHRPPEGVADTWFTRTSPVAMLCSAPFFHDIATLPEGGTWDWEWDLTIADA